MAKSKIKIIITRFFITLLGVAFILWGLSTILLGIYGEKTAAVITSIRREGGERNEIIRGQYTYNISYSFKLPDGKSVDGYTKRIGDAVYLKADGKSRAFVRYLSFFPFINTLEQNTKPGIGQLILVGIGCFLIFIINRRKTNVVK